MWLRTQGCLEASSLSTCPEGPQCLLPGQTGKCLQGKRGDVSRATCDQDQATPSECTCSCTSWHQPQCCLTTHAGTALTVFALRCLSWHQVKHCESSCPRDSPGQVHACADHAGLASMSFSSAGMACSLLWNAPQTQLLTQARNTSRTLHGRRRMDLKSGGHNERAWD